MEIRDYEKILDAMQETGVYVIRESDHVILYFNRRVSQVAPKVRIGMPCQDVWEGYCDNCPLWTIGNRRENRTINYNPHLGGVVDITATRILWEDWIPAFAVTVTPHMESTGFPYRRVLRINLTQDRFAVAKAAPGEELLLGDTGVYSQWLEELARDKLIHPNDLDRLMAVARPEHLRQTLRPGIPVNCIYRRRWPEGFRWNLLEIVADAGYAPDNQRAVLCLKDVHDVLRQGLEREEITQRSQEIIRFLGKQSFGIYRVNLNTGTANLVRVDGQMREELSAVQVDWDEWARPRAEQRIHPDYQQEFIEKFSLEGLRIAQDAGEEKVELLCLWSTGADYRYISASARFGQERDGNRYAVIATQDVDERMRQELKNRQDLQDRARIIGSLIGMFVATYYIDLEKETFRVVSQLNRVGEVLGDEVNCTAALRVYAQNFVHPDDREEYLRVMSCDNWRKTLGWWNPYISFEYRKNPVGLPEEPGNVVWMRCTAVLAQSSPDGQPRAVVYVAQDVSESRQGGEQASS